ncbi:hypothetical protein [Comamonas aquatilis]
MITSSAMRQALPPAMGADRGQPGFYGAGLSRAQAWVAHFAKP